MATYKKAFLIYLSIICLGCTATRVSSKPTALPTESFVKIIHTMKVESCKNKKDPRCPIGEYSSLGSGMAVNVFSNTMTVLTAGHVCDTQPTEKIDKVTQLVYVVDHKETKHQAWPVLTSFYNQVGSGDLCLLWVPSLEVKKVSFAKSGPKIGDELYYIGAPLGIHHPPTVPIFKGIYSGPVDASSGLVTFPAAGGSSGSAVINKDGKIVGVVFAANPNFHHVSLISSFSSLKIFLSKAKKELSKNKD